MALRARLRLCGDYLTRLHAETGVNTVLCQMVFGDMRFEDAARSIEHIWSRNHPRLPVNA